MEKGIVVVAYQGMGKSTLCKDNEKYYDLESSGYYYKDNPEWFKKYVEDAIKKVSEEGYDVCFISSYDEVVREYLLETGYPFLIFYPMCSKDDMMNRLAIRYFQEKTIKNASALANCVLDYDNDINNLKKYYNSIGSETGFINDEALKMFSDMSYKKKIGVIKMIGKIKEAKNNG